MGLSTRDLPDGKVCIEGYRWEPKKEHLEDPEKIDFVTVKLPKGVSAKFRHPESGTSQPT
jgi:hypothetical protein